MKRTLCQSSLFLVCSTVYVHTCFTLSAHLSYQTNVFIDESFSSYIHSNHHQPYLPSANHKSTNKPWEGSSTSLSCWHPSTAISILYTSSNWKGCGTVYCTTNSTCAVYAVMFVLPAQCMLLCLFYLRGVCCYVCSVSLGFFWRVLLKCWRE